ncbi:ferritin-like fold-containing protein [Janibacter sp. G1551]|uniref:ferritin-like fold-containing protein n=1 Tax=Janibacter sp. G1551 TaxID=3420440 RepID=UPI003D03F83B
MSDTSPSAGAPVPPIDAAAQSSDPSEQGDANAAGVIDLLGAIGYNLLSGFTRIVADSELAPTLGVRSQMVTLARAELANYDRVVARLEELGTRPEEAMDPFVAAVDAFHARTRPSTFLEGIVKVYVGDGIANDFYREVSAFVDPATRELVEGVETGEEFAAFVVRTVREATKADPRVGGPLALYGRRLVGEALSQGQAVAVERDALAALLVDNPASDLLEIGRMFGRLTEAHTRRMGALGLAH